MPQSRASHANPAAVRERREAAGRTQGDLADEVGVNRMTIYWLERSGRTSLPTLSAVAKALDCTVEELLP